MHASATDGPWSPATYLITGIQAAGKSTIAQALAEQLPEPSVHVHGDQFRRWIVNGRRDMTPNADAAAVDQLRLRYQLTATTCDLYAAAGFSVVAQDVILGPYLQLMVDQLRSRPLHIVVLVPRAEVVAERERLRAKDSYQRWTVDLLDRGLRHDTPRLGLWLDTSELTISQTVEEILRRSSEALLRTDDLGSAHTRHRSRSGEGHQGRRPPHGTPGRVEPAPREDHRQHEAREDKDRAGRLIRAGARDRRRKAPLPTSLAIGHRFESAPCGAVL